MKNNPSKTAVLIVLSLISLIAIITVFVIWNMNINHKIYNKESLEKIVGTNLTERDEQYGNNPYKKYQIYGDNSSKFNYIEFYVFENDKAALNTFNEIKSVELYNISAEGDNFVQGYLNNVCDASIEGYYYISGNLIVYTYVSITSCWGDVYEVSTFDPEALEIAEKRIELINETF